MVLGFVGLGNMGSVLAGNLVASGFEVLTHDVAGDGRSPVGATFVLEITRVAQSADVVVFSLPNGDICSAVAEALVAAPGSRVAQVVDTSTAGVEATERMAVTLERGGIGLVSAPVSGGIAGARARTLAVIHSGAPSDCRAVRPVLEGLSDVIHHVGDSPVLAQAMKLANNFLSATALAATSEAVAFGVAMGLDMERMLSVLNASSGRSAASEDKFPNHVLNERYASGFANTLMAKDVLLYLDAVRTCGAPADVGKKTATIWARFAEGEPNVDFTRIYPFVVASNSE